MRSAILGLAFCVSAALFPATGQAMVYTFDFDEFSGGDVITSITRGGLSASVSATGGIDQVVAFDTNNPTGGDSDLGADIKDLSGTAKAFGLIPIIQENGTVNNGTVSDPDDAAGGGTFTFVFNQMIRFLGADFIDIEEPGATVFLDGIQILGPVGASGDQQFASVGGDPLNRFGTTLSIRLQGSGSFDNLAVATVPLPMAGWLLISGVGGLFLMGRRRRAV